MWALLAAIAFVIFVVMLYQSGPIGEGIASVLGLFGIMVLGKYLAMLMRGRE